MEEDLVQEINDLRILLREKENTLKQLRLEKEIVQECGLTNEEISRYSRQILMPQFGVKGTIHEDTPSLRHEYNVNGTVYRFFQVN